MDKEIVVRLSSSFEAMVQTHSETGTEFWCARDLQLLLGYAQWRSFESVIEKAINSCRNASYDPADHFAHVRKMVDVGNQRRSGTWLKSLYVAAASSKTTR